LRWLAVRAANRDFTGALAEWNDCVPFYLALRNYASIDLPRPEQFLDWVVGNLAGEMPKGWVQAILRRRALVLIDGLDDLPVCKRAAVTSWLTDIVRDFPEARIVLSSRPAALKAGTVVSLWDKLDGIGLTRSALQPMSLVESEALVQQWHAAVARGVSD